MKEKIFSLFLAGFFFFFFAPAKTFATRASVMCTPSTGTYNVGDTFSVEYTFDTRGFPTYGADLNITYDTHVIEAVDSQSTPITSVTNWTNVITNTVDKQLGKIRLDFGKEQPAFTGNTSLGRITFKAKAPGQAEFKYLFFQPYDDTTPGVTKVWGKKDGTNLSNILTDVTNCVFVVMGQPTPTPGIPTPTSVVPPTSPSQVTELPRAGIMENTLSFLLLGFALLTLGGFSVAFLKF